MRCFLCGITLSSHNASDVKENGCKRCFPVYGEGVGVNIEDKSVTPDKIPTRKGVSSTPIHHAKKNIGCRDDFIFEGLLLWYTDFEEVIEWDEYTGRRCF